MEKTVSRALVVLAVVLALGVGFYAGREVWPADGPFRLSSNGRILLNRRTGKTWIENVGQWEVYVVLLGDAARGP